MGRTFLQGDEGVLLRRWLLLSVVVHALVFLVRPLDWLAPAPLPVNEWVMDADILPDLPMDGANEDQLPDAKPAEAPEIPSNLLPQLPQRFSVKESTPQEEAVSLEDAPKDGAKKEQAKTEAPSPPLDLPQEDNKIDLQELRRRLALERLRREQEIESTRTRAPKRSELAQLKEDLLKKGTVRGGSGDAGAASQRGYVEQLRRSIRRHWSLPDAYNLKDANLMSVLHVTLNEQGGVMDLKVERASGDAAFDDLAMRAVQEAAPLPKPPKEFVGRPIPLQFSPKTL